MESKILTDTAIQILLLTIMSILGIQFYEIGYCRFFGIPTEYISFELNKSSYLLLTFLATFSILASLLETYISQLFALSKVKNKFIRMAAILAFLAVLVFAFRRYLKALTHLEVITLASVFIFGFILLVSKHKPDDETEKLISKFSITKFLSKRIGDTVGPLFMISTVICTIMFCIGYVKADHQYEFMARPDNKTVLLKKYGDNVVFGILQEKKINGIIVERNISRIDTLHLITIE